jgi:predicted phosphoribosyltransferase
VEVAYEVAKSLRADLSILVSRKLPYPHNPEAGFGAVAEDGSVFVFEESKKWLSTEAIQRSMEEQKEEIKRRIIVLRGGSQLPEINGRLVILVDDGIAMGSTMRAGIMLCRNRGAKKIIVAAPVAGPRVAEELENMVDEVFILEKPPNFFAVAEAYRNWYDVSDEEVLEIMEKWEKSK